MVSSIWWLIFENSTYFFSLLCSNLSSFIKVTLISDNILKSFFIHILLNLLEPVLHIIKRLLISNIVHNYYTVSTSIVAACDCFEAILTSCIPLSYNKFTTCTFTLVYPTSTYLILFIDNFIHNRPRSCYSSYGQTFCHYIGGVLNFCLLLNCQ